MKKKSSLTVFLSAVVFLLSLSCAQASDEKILGGSPMRADSQVSKSVVWLRFGGWVCTAVPISPRHLLTAAHCVSSRPAVSKIRVLMGADKVPGPRVLRYRIHGGYAKENGLLKGDLAVIRLAAPLGKGMIPALLSATGVARGTRLITAGFGAADRAERSTGTLRQSAFVFGQSARFRSWRFSDGTRALHLSGGKPLCSGDSGGPTFERTADGLRLVGVHSTSDCVASGHDVYAPDHLPWIRSMLAL